MSQSLSDDLPRKQQIEKFLNSHKSKSQLPEVSVKEMRHIIPLFFMETHIEKCGHYTKKVKGLWERRPSDWPPNVPFVDPNNKLKNEGGKGCKPKKELLGQMLDYLIKRYEKAPKNDGPALDLGAVIPLLSDPGLPMMDLVESDDPLFGQSIDNSVDQNQLMRELFHSSSGSYYSQSMPPSMPLDLDNYEGNDEFENSVLFESIQEQEEMIKHHGQVMDNDDYNGGEDWNPLAQLQRIQQKLSFLEKQKSMKSAELKSMVTRYKELKEVAKASSNWLSLIDNLHALEKDIDIMKFSSRMSPNRFNEISFDKTTDLMKPDQLIDMIICQNKMVADDVCNEVPIGVEDPELMTSLNIEPRSGGPQDSGPVNNLSLRFMSGPAPEVLNASAPKTSMLSENCYGGSRQAEYMSQPLSDAQYFSFPMSTTLSENCKPIQAAEDDIPQCQNPLQDLGDLPLLQENTHFRSIDEVLSYLNISNGTESNTGTFAPVQETNTINLAYLDVGQVNAVAGSAGTVPQLIFSGGNGLGVESSSAVPIASAEPTKNVTIPTEILHLLLQQAFRGFVQPAPAVAEQRSISMVNGFQPQAANNRRDVKPSGKRSRLLLDDEEMEVTVSSLQPSPEGSCSTLIPTMVEEMGTSDALLRFPKKSKRMT